MELSSCEFKAHPNAIIQYDIMDYLDINYSDTKNDKEECAAYIHIYVVYVREPPCW